MNKNIFLPIIIGVALLGSFLGVNANFGAMKQNLNLERYNRLDAERNLDAAIKNSNQLEQKLGDAKRKLEGIQNVVDEGQSAASELKATVENTAKENSELKVMIKKMQDDLEQNAAAERAAAEAAVKAAQAPPLQAFNEMKL